MIKIGRPLVGLLTTGALLSATGPASASSSDRPFTATFSGHMEMPIPGSAVFDGAGHANHMGRIGTEGHALITGLDESSCDGGLANVHVETLTSANGDTLTITSHDVACPLGLGKFQGSGHWTVTGGSGRFSDATGAGSFAGSLNLGAGTFSITLNGTLGLGG